MAYMQKLYLFLHRVNLWRCPGEINNKNNIKILGRAVHQLILQSIVIESAIKMIIADNVGKYQYKCGKRQATRCFGVSPAIIIIKTIGSTIKYYYERY